MSEQDQEETMGADVSSMAAENTSRNYDISNTWVSLIVDFPHEKYQQLLQHEHTPFLSNAEYNQIFFEGWTAGRCNCGARIDTQVPHVRRTRGNDCESRFSWMDDSPVADSL